MKRAADTSTSPIGNGSIPEAPPPIPLQSQRNHTLWIVGAITIMGVTCIVCGCYLIMHNHESSGILLVSSGGTGTITGLFGFLRGTPPAPTASTATATATAPPTDQKK